jgi:hypothetical protein
MRGGYGGGDGGRSRHCPALGRRGAGGQQGGNQRGQRLGDVIDAHAQVQVLLPQLVQRKVVLGLELRELQALLAHGARQARRWERPGVGHHHRRSVAKPVRGC